MQCQSAFRSRSQPTTVTKLAPLKMAPQQTQFSHNTELTAVDLGDIYVQIMEQCRPFYSLSDEEKHLHSTLPPRLDDALEAMHSGSKNNVSESFIERMASGEAFGFVVSLQTQPDVSSTTCQLTIMLIVSLSGNFT